LTCRLAAAEEVFLEGGVPTRHCPRRLSFPFSIVSFTDRPGAAVR